MIAEQLKSSILQAAIQGKLTEQLQEDGDARDLLKDKLLKEIPEDKFPFDIPENWLFARLNEICSVVRGGSPRPAGSPEFYDGNIPFLKVADLTADDTMYLKSYKSTIKPTGLKKTRFVKAYTLLLTNSGATLGVPKICTFDTTFNDGIAAFLDVPNYIDLEYFYFFLKFRTRWFRDYTARGQGQPNLNTDLIGEMVLPIPPLAEQKRIVERLKESLPKIAELETEKSKLDVLQRAFPKKMKDSVLQYAIEGKLTEQLESDGDAHDLVKEIQREKAQLVKEGKIKKEKPLPEITEDEIPFDIPENWCWVRTGEIVEINPRNKIADETAVSFIPMALIKDGYSNAFSSERRLWRDVKSGFTHFADNDLVVAKITPCFQNRKSAVMKNLINGHGAGTTELHVLRPLTDTVLSEYLLYLVKTEYFIFDGTLSMTGTAGQQRVGKKYIQNFLCPLPPVDEQKRIIKRLNEIIPKIQVLKNQVTKG
jgi:type I restriction enzyme S subunit